VKDKGGRSGDSADPSTGSAFRRGLPQADSSARPSDSASDKAASGQADGRAKEALRQRAEEIVRKKAAPSPVDQGTSLPKETRQTLHELRARQVELEMRNEELLETEERLRFESLLADLSSAFINLPVDEVDRQIEDAQHRICECLGLDLSSLWQRPAASPSDLTLTHIHAPPGFPRLPQPMEASEFFPWCLRQVLAGRTVALSSIEEAPAEAARDKEVWRQLGIKTTLTVPLSTGAGPTIGALSFNTTRAERTWPEAIVKRLYLVAHVFANAIERKRAGEALRESEARLHLATETAGVGLWAMDPDAGSVWASAKTRELFQFDPDRPLAYQDFIKRIHPDDRDMVDRAVREAISCRRGFAVEYRVSLPDGQTRWIVSRGNLGGPGGGPLHCTGVSVDVTDRKQAELEVLRQRGELAHVARVSMISQLASGLAHELSQPLGAILRNAEAAELFLQEPSPDLDELRAILADIRKDDHRAGGVIDRMRAMMKRREFEHRCLDLGVLVDEVVTLVRPDAERRRVRLAPETDAVLPPVQGDQVQLQQVLLNLLLNAMDALDGNPSAVRIVTVRARSAGSAVEVAVSDNGRGIPADSLPRMFEPFFTTKPQGLGMGLAICRTIIKAHGGRVWVENNAGGGATFTFSLPVAEGGDAR
jgi:PAS domain S-box-containing protein